MNDWVEGDHGDYARALTLLADRPRLSPAGRGRPRARGRGRGPPVEPGPAVATVSVGASADLVAVVLLPGSQDAADEVAVLGAEAGNLHGFFPGSARGRRWNGTTPAITNGANGAPENAGTRRRAQGRSRPPKNPRLCHPARRRSGRALAGRLLQTAAGRDGRARFILWPARSSSETGWGASIERIACRQRFLTSYRVLASCGQLTHQSAWMWKIQND